MQCINNSCAPCQCGPGQFCHNGVCGGCETNSECEPLICYSGTCGACGSDSQCESAFGLNTCDEDVGDCYNYEGGGGGAAAFSTRVKSAAPAAPMTALETARIHVPEEVAAVAEEVCAIRTSAEWPVGSATEASASPTWTRSL